MGSRGGAAGGGGGGGASPQEARETLVGDARRIFAGNTELVGFIDQSTQDRQRYLLNFNVRNPDVPGSIMDVDNPERRAAQDLNRFSQLRGGTFEPIDTIFTRNIVQVEWVENLP